MSTYNKTIWQDGDIITADKMNNIENGIYSYNEDITNLSESVGDLNSALNAVEDTFDVNNNYFGLSSPVDGHYIKKDGTIAEHSVFCYASLAITSEMVGQKLYIDGTQWYQIMPYIFIGTSTNIEFPDLDSVTDVTQRTAIEFIPSETGTLYVQKRTEAGYGQHYSVYTKNIANLNASYIPSNISDSVKDQTDFVEQPLTLTRSKRINISTQAIVDTSQTASWISQYVPVSPYQRVRISSQNFYSYGLYAFFDANKVFISGVASAAGGDMTYLYVGDAVAPVNAAYVVVGFWDNDRMSEPHLWLGQAKSLAPSKRWYGLKWACIGDSLTAYGEATSYHYYDYISARTGIQPINMGISGTGYARGDDNFMTRALNVPLDVDVITFFGSGNDLSAEQNLGDITDNGTTTICGCINTALDNLYSVNPIANVGIITPTPWINSTPADNNNNFKNYVNALIQISARRSVPCLDLYHCSGLDPNNADVRSSAYSHDNGGGVHPDETGHKIIASKIQAFLETMLLH